MQLDELDYDLPAKLIAQRPLWHSVMPRRLLALDRNTGAIEDLLFTVLPDLLRGDELLVLNDARVIPARLFGRRVGCVRRPPSNATRREHLTGNVEVLLTKQVELDTWEALVRPGEEAAGWGADSVRSCGGRRGRTRGRNSHSRRTRPADSPISVAHGRVRRSASRSTRAYSTAALYRA